MWGNQGRDWQVQVLKLEETLTSEKVKEGQHGLDLETKGKVAYNEMREVGRLIG